MSSLSGTSFCNIIKRLKVSDESWTGALRPVLFLLDVVMRSAGTIAMHTDMSISSIYLVYIW